MGKLEKGHNNEQEKNDGVSKTVQASGVVDETV
jgi:hypothetical protein